MQDSFHALLSKLPERLCGNWIKKKSSYEKDLCLEIGWRIDKNRYFDAQYEDLNIEIKKGKSIWLDLVRYSEIVLGYGVQNTITAFFIPNKDTEYIEKILFVYTNDLIKILKIDKEIAKQIIYLNKGMIHSLNCQANLTINDVTKIAFFQKKF